MQYHRLLIGLSSFLLSWTSYSSADWYDCDVKFNQSSTLLNFSDDGGWPTPPFDAKYTSNAIAVMNWESRTNRLRIPFFHDYGMISGKGSYIYIEYSPQECGSYFTGGKYMKFMGSFDSSRNTRVSLWAVVRSRGRSDDRGSWNIASNYDSFRVIRTEGDKF